MIHRQLGSTGITVSAIGLGLEHVEADQMQPVLHRAFDGGITYVDLIIWAADRQAAFMFGRPTAIFGFLVTMASNGSLFRDTWVTGMETVLGFVVGNVLGTVLGLALWYSPFVSRVVSPFVVALGSIPIIALAPMVIIWFGTGLASKIAMATLSVVVVALVTSYKGATSVDPDQINLMRTLGARKWQIFNRLVVPASLTDIFAGLKLTVGFALLSNLIC